MSLATPSAPPARSDATTAKSDLSDAKANLLSDAHGLLQKSRSVVRKRALFRWWGILLGLAFILILLDYLLHREEAGLRYLWFLIFFSSAVYSAWRILVPAFRFSPDYLELAQWIEQHDTQVGQELATALQLAAVPSHDFRYGSDEFRQTALRNWNSTSSKPDWEAYLDRAPLRRSLGYLLCALGLGIGSWIIWPNKAWTGVKRLAAPWAAAPWPRADTLAFRDLPAACALGSDLQLEVIDQSPPLPERVQVLVRQVDETADASLPLETLNAKNLGDVAVVNLSSLERSVEVRAVGGDDQSMPWQRIDVIPVPRVAKHTFIVQPPEYSGLVTQHESEFRVQVLRGSRILLEGELSEPVSALTIEPSQVEAPELRSNPEMLALRVRLEADGRRFSLLSDDPNTEFFQAMIPMRWQFAISGEAGLEIMLPQIWSIDIKQDRPPVINLQDSEIRELTAEASLPIRAEVSDDLGLAKVELLARQGWQAPESEIGQPEDAVATQSLWSAKPDQFDRRIALDELLPLKELLTLETGDQFELWLQAEDFAGQVTQSRRIQFRVQSATEIMQAVSARAQDLARRIEQVADSQRQNRQLSLRVSETLKQTSEVDGQTLKSLSNIGQIQSSIRKQLDEGVGSLTDHATRLLQMLEGNQLGNSSEADQLRKIQAQLKGIASSSMADAIRFSSQARRQGEQAMEDDNSALQAMQGSLEQVVQAQASALRDLEALYAELAKTRAQQSVQRELLAIRNDQASLQEATDATRLEEIEQRSRDKTSRKRETLAADQLALARRLDEFLRQARALADAQETNAEAVTRSADSITQGRVSEKMRQSANELSSGKTNSSSETQQTVLKALDAAMDQLGVRNDSNNGFADRAKQWRALGQALSGLAEQQSELTRSLPETADDRQGMEQAADRQAELQQQTRAQATVAASEGSLSSLIEEAIRKQQAVSQALQEEKASVASESSGEAAQELRDAAQLAQERSQDFESQAQQLENARMLDSLVALIDQQTPVVTGLSAEQLQQAADQLSQSQQQEVRALASDQEAIRQRLSQVRSEMAEMPTFSWTLEKVDQDMARAVAAAQRLRVVPEALDGARSALTKLELIVEALQEREFEQADSEQDSKPQDQTPGNEDQQSLPPVTVLKLMRGLQSEINQRTREIHEWQEQEGQRNLMLRELSNQQQALAQQLEALLEDLAEPEPKQ